MYTVEQITKAGDKAQYRYAIEPIIEALKELYGSEPQHLLQQTPCSTLRELLEQEFNRAKAAHPSDSSKPGWRKSVEYLGCIETVLQHMEDMKPVA